MSATPIRLGLMPPLTGLVALYGPEIVWAAEIATAEINAAGGLLGCPLELIVEDDGSMPETAVAAAKRLREVHGVNALIGNLLSNSRIAVATMVAEPTCTPYLNFSFYEGSISGRYFFHFAALPNQQIDKMIPYMAERFGLKMFFAGNNYEWPRGSIDAAKRALTKLGGEVVGELYLPIGISNEQLEHLLDDVAKSGADVFVPYFAGSDQIALLNRFAERGLKQRMAVVMGHYDEVLAGCLPPEVREGLFSCNTYFMAVNTPTNQAYLAQLERHPEVDALWPAGRGVLTNFGEGTYACVHAYAKAVTQAGTTDPEAVVAALEQIRFTSCQGEIVMDPVTHHAAVNCYLARGHADGTLSLVESFGRIAPQIPDRYRNSFTVPAAAAPSLAPPAPAPVSATGLFERIFDATDVAVITTDEQGVILQANRSTSEMLGYDADELPGMSVHFLLPPHQRARHAQMFELFRHSADTQRRMGHRSEIEGYRKDGTQFPAEASISKFHDQGRLILVAILRDITAKKQAEEDLLWRATHDPLTRLPNRALIKDRLTKALQRSQRSQQCVALLFIDLDHFKLINDTHGHEAGDQLLVHVANRLLEQVRPGDTVGRLGGDEFVVLCENIDQNLQIERLAERINDALRLPLQLEHQTVVCTASIGLALGQGDIADADAMLRNADAAMYLSKEQGRDGWRPFSNELTDKARTRLELVNGLRHAMERDELTLVFQPIVSTQNGRIKGAEALLRWTPESGPISPAVFIPIAEQNGLVNPLGTWVFTRACETLARLMARYPEEHFYLSVNLSTKQLDQPHLAEEFAAILQATGADPKRLVLELTETSLFSDVEKNLRELNRLADLGMRVAVDDFGTGYSSLLQLLRLPVSLIKIDREFVDGLDKRHDSRLIINAVIKMARALGKTVIAEGVENENQLFELKALQCEAVQGFLCARPMSEAALMDNIDNQCQLDHEQHAQVYYVIYVSKASAEVDQIALKTILEQSQRNNQRLGITGFLIYRHGYFLQLLEGRQEVLNSLVERIINDPRHQQIQIVGRGYAPHRLFSDWSMGYWQIIDFDDATTEVSAWQKRTLSLLEISADTRLAYAFFEALSH
ncbi:PAS domain S-box-containing protein/diguanylate cyclase (GGDEF) domain-containing protein [Ectothiorhodospira magna]|uniref:PAS domain S-box-containing protein/diguanylate cyclase (GGDEF) domain-containing protein n=1 Tax=Ectothiorhodospira magna TaxID=867345 RepID=A0A1H8Z2Q1_9GAMM|nr:EAL domain-containing protein [Ectothiorhodospira magna]SEP58735.1 PAS domain S-box-containing protein/diguanylate cyclase (GGDEF) domain-containing protein [Ectothiorhodospira magna]